MKRSNERWDVLHLAVPVIIALAVLNAATVAEAERKSPPSPRASAKKHYRELVQKFHDENNSLRIYDKQLNVVFIGDSLTERFDLKASFPLRSVLNRGIGSDVIGNALAPGDNRGILKRMDESLFEIQATDAFLMIGVNDIGDSHSMDDMEAGYRQILELIQKRAPALRVHVQSVLPMRGKYAKDNPVVVEFNGRLRKLAKEFGHDYIDLHSLMANEKGELKPELTTDDVHLTAAGYKIWIAEINRTLGWK